MLEVLDLFDHVFFSPAFLNFKCIIAYQAVFIALLNLVFAFYKILLNQIIEQNDKLVLEIRVDILFCS